MMTPIEELFRNQEHIYNLNANWRSYHQEVAEFCLPRKAFVTRPRTTGEKISFHKLFDSTAIRSLKIMAAGFHSNLTNPASKWFNLRTRELKFMDSKAVRMWFKSVEDIIFAILNTSNFDTTMQEFYMDSGCFGTGVIFTQEDLQDVVRFSLIPIDQVGIEEDSAGRVNRMYRMFKYTAIQAYELWGNMAGEVVMEAINDKKYTKEIEFLHYVGPRGDREAGKVDAKNMPWQSVWAEKTKKYLIKESGYLDFPFAVGRFYKDAKETMGFSPAMDELADIKLINAEKRTLIRAAMKAVDPALIAPSKGFILPLNANPGAMNYRDPKVGVDSLTTMPSDQKIPIGFEMVRDVQGDIEKGFFVPLFQAFSQITKQMTIPEVQRRIAENMVLLGPTVGRFTQEVLDPIITRVFNISYRRGILPQPPPVIINQDLDIVYISQLAKAQRLTEINEIQSFLADLGAIAQVKPSVLDKIDEDKVVDIMAKIRGITPDLMRDEFEIQKIRQQRAEAQAMQARLQVAQQGADIVKTASDANKSGKASAA